MRNEKVFNLTEEPWIRVETSNCDIIEVSLADALICAHEFAGLAGELPTQDVAILRLLLAVLHTIVSRNGPGGDDILIDEDHADEVWGELWDAGQFPEETIRAYLSQWYDRFWLFHPERPFYQVPDLEAGAEPKEAAKLNGEVSESANKIRMFSPRSGEWKQALTYGEAARWLVHINSYDDASLKKPSPKIGWLGKLGVVTARGNNLFETLMLNLILLDHNEEPWGRNIPTWEAPLRRKKELKLCSVSIPDNPAQLYTMQFRRMCLLAEAGFVRQYKAASGDWFDDTAIRGGFRESMTAWRLTGDKTGKWHVPRKFSREVQIWREFSSMVSAREAAEKEPGTVQWCRWLVMNDLLPKDRLITFDTFGIEYDKSMSSSITGIFSDRMSFHGSILSEAGAVWRVLIQREVDRCKEFADSVGKLAANLEKAAGHVERDGKGNLVTWYNMASAEKAKEDYFYQIDVPFRAWLEKPDPDQNDTQRETLRREWADTAKRTALRLGEELALRAGDTALVGRFIQEGKEKKHYSTPEAIRDFRIELNSISKKEG